MSNILNEMSSSLMRYSKVTSQVIPAQVSITDTSQVIISFDGGEWHTSPDASMVSSGNIIRAALKTRCPQVMLERLGHPGCAQCKSRDTCTDCVEIWAPIIVQQKVLGAIGAVWKTPKEQELVRENPNTYLNFLVQMADLIAFEAMQKMATKKNEAVIKLLEAVVDRIDSGVIVLDKDGNILRLNQTGRQILHESLSKFKSTQVTLQMTGETIDHLSVYQISDEQSQCLVAGSLYQLDIDPYSQMLIFSHLNQMRGAQESAFHQITGVSPQMQTIRERIQSAARSSSCVLISAESGLQKNLYARAIHDESDRREKPFVVINCRSLPSQDLEKYLFGSVTLSNVAGSRGKPGLIETAAGGTLFVNNIEALPRSIQLRLVHVIEHKEITRVGSKKPRKINIRIIAAAAPDLWDLCQSNEFDKNLYYLISVLPIVIPPLRERREDIRPLAYMYINSCAHLFNKTVTKIEDEFWELMETYHWPGNVRELQNIIEYSINMLSSPGVLSADLLAEHIHPKGDQWMPQEMDLETVERNTISRVLQLCKLQGYSQQKAADILGIGIATLYRKIKKYNLNI